MNILQSKPLFSITKLAILNGDIVVAVVVVVVVVDSVNIEW